MNQKVEKGENAGNQHFTEIFSSFIPFALLVYICLKLFLHMYLFQHTEEMSSWKTLGKNVKLLKTSNVTFFHNVFYAIFILKSFDSQIPVVVCSFFEFGIVSKWRKREWVNTLLHR